MGRTKSPESLRLQLRTSIESGEMVVAPGVFDAASAMLVELTGFPAAYISGFATEGAMLGRPDMGFLTKDLMLGHAGRISKAVDIPIICDMEEGYGSAVQLEDHIREFEAVGLAGVHLDDEVPPCKCPFIPDIPPVSLISIEEMVGRIKRAVRARRDPNFLIIARCDVFSATTVSDPNEVGIPKSLYREYVERSQAYAEAGADMVFVVGNTKDDLVKLATEIKKPLLGITNPWLRITLPEFQEAGASVVITSMPILFVAMKAMRDALVTFRETGSVQGFAHMMLPDSEYWKLMRTDEYKTIFQEYSVP